ASFPRRRAPPPPLPLPSRSQRSHARRGTDTQAVGPRLSPFHAHEVATAQIIEARIPGRGMAIEAHERDPAFVAAHPQALLPLLRGAIPTTRHSPGSTAGGDRARTSGA